MFSERLERLIEAALQDGQLTEQEKAAIIKRAEAEGEDINEVDIYIQSLQQKRQQEFNEKAQQAATEEMVAQKKAREAKIAAAAEEEKERAKLLRKCPACGTPIPATTNVCPNCGHIVESSDITNEISNLIQLIKKCSTNVDVFYSGEINAVTFRDKSICNNDPDFNKAYNIIDKNYDGTKYKIESKYKELMSDLSLKYGANPIVQSFIKSEKKRFAELMISKVNRMIDGGWRFYHDSIWTGLDLLSNEYKEFVDSSFLDMSRTKLESLAEVAKQKREEAEVQELNKKMDSIKRMYADQDFLDYQGNIKRSYFREIEGLETIHGDNPLVQDFLKEEKKKRVELYKDKVNEKLNSIRYGSLGSADFATHYIDILADQYSDYVDSFEIEKLRKKLEKTVKKAHFIHYSPLGIPVRFVLELFGKA